MSDDTDVQNPWDLNAPEWARRLANGLDLGRDEVIVPCLIEMVRARCAGRVLDAGCGSADLALALRDLLDIEVVGLDSSPAMCDEARRVAREEMEIVCADLRQTPFESESFDGVVANLVLQGVDDLHAACKEVARIVRPGGFFLFSLLHPARISPIAPPFQQDPPPDVIPRTQWAIADYATERRIEARIRLGGRTFLPAPVPYHHRILSTYAAALRDANLVTIDIREPLPSPALLAAHPRLIEFWTLVPLLVWMAEKRSEGGTADATVPSARVAPPTRD